MVMAVLLAGAVALGWLLARGTAANPIADGPRLRQDRRLRWVERHPGEVNTGDVERVLLAHGLDLSDVRLVSAKAFALGIKPFTMWMWLKTYGARELAVAVAAEVPHEQLLEHLSEGTLPRFDELEVFAALNGLAAASQRTGRAARRGITAPVARVREQVRLRRTLADLDIHDPGDWPSAGFRHHPPPTPEPRRLPPGWDSFFDDLAA